MAKSICPACSLEFNSNGAFDKHRVGSYGEPITASNGVTRYGKPQRRCLTVEEMQDLGMQKNERGLWVIALLGESNFWREKESEEEEIA